MTAGLSDDDFVPLLQATASRSLDTCLRGARGLAMLGDPRAFGLLLQLSREDNAAARVEVCRALAALHDERGTDRLRSLLFDPEPSVRDAAYTALAAILQSEPLRCAEAGLNAGFEDVRQRGLQTLVEALRQKKAAAEGPALELLGRALNDGSAAVRSEAFKATLNLQVAGGEMRTLRFVLNSIYADVRREVLTEVMAQSQHPWAWNLLLEFYNDADPGLRAEAFDFAVRKSKELPPLEAALLSQFADVRKLSVDALVKKHTPAAQALLVRALADADKAVRLLALAELVGEDARAPLTSALTSPHADVRVRAAIALARHGDRAALGTLLELAAAPEPTERERQPDWMEIAGLALDGLAELGEVSSLPTIVPLLQSEHAALRERAARALAWVAPPHHAEALRQALHHADPNVKYRAALGLARSGDSTDGTLVFSEAAAKILSDDERLAAAFALGSAGEDRLTVFLDDANEGIRSRALLLFMLRELADRQGAPVRCLACLAALPPRIRLTAARGLGCFADAGKFRDFVVGLVNDRGDEPAWKVAAADVEAVARLLVYAPAPLRARTAQLLSHLSEKEQASWDQARALHFGRFASELAAANAAARERKAAPLQYSPEQLREMAFGAYVGLVREQGGRHTTEAAAARARQTALGRVQELAESDARFRAAARPVLVRALADPNQAVRVQAFDQLAAAGVDADTLGAAALGAGHTDVGVRGLEAMAGGGTSAQGQAVLEEAMRSRTDDLATEAAKLLAARRGLVPVAAIALTAGYKPLREQAVAWLVGEYDRSPAAREALRQALQSRHRSVVEAAAFELATKKDAAAYPALVQMLKDAREAGPQRRVIEALRTLGDPRSPDAFLDRIENDPDSTALVNELFSAAGSFRLPASADRLLRMSENPKWSPALAAAFTVSGFDQEVEDPEDENPDRRWEEKQFPRHDAVLARVLRRSLDDKSGGALPLEFMAAARWARGNALDPVLALAAVHPRDDVRNEAVGAIGWRLRKRGGPADTLVKLLTHRDSSTRVTAAEELAKAGRADGLSILLAAIDLEPDVSLRGRSVLALGELGDARALDVLLKIVNEPDHVLKADAAEALGHLGRSARSDEVLALLEGLARGNDHLAQRALQGLRWLDRAESWQHVRRRAAVASDPLQALAVKLLGDRDEPATRDLLRRLLTETDDGEVFDNALASARKLWGHDSLEPDYAALQNQNRDADDVDDVMRRVQERGDAKRLLEILPRAADDVAARLRDILLQRHPAPVAEARAVVTGPDAPAAGVAANLLGRAGDASAAPAVAAALKRWWEEYDRLRQDETLRGVRPGQRAGALADPLEALARAAGLLGGAADTLSAIARTRSGVPYDRSLRQAAVAALAAGKPSTPTLAALEEFATGGDPETRPLAAEAVARADAARGATLAAKSLADRVTFNRLADRARVDVAATLRGAAAQVHYQGVVVPHLVARGDVQGLAAVAGNAGFNEETRLGAVEGLAGIAKQEAEAALVRIGITEERSEELRKAAWRGARRSRRARVAKGGGAK